MHGKALTIILLASVLALSTLSAEDGSSAHRVHDIGDHFTAKPLHQISAVSFIKPLHQATFVAAPLWDASNRTPVCPYYLPHPEARALQEIGSPVEGYVDATRPPNQALAGIVSSGERPTMDFIF